MSLAAVAAATVVAKTAERFLETNACAPQRFWSIITSQRVSVNFIIPKQLFVFTAPFHFVHSPHYKQEKIKKGGRGGVQRLTVASFSR